MFPALRLGLKVQRRALDTEQEELGVRKLARKDRSVGGVGNSYNGVQSVPEVTLILGSLSVAWMPGLMPVTLVLKLCLLLLRSAIVDISICHLCLVSRFA